AAGVALLGQGVAERGGAALAGGSVSAPERTTSETLTRGTSWRSTRNTGRPLRRASRLGTGGRNSTGADGGGGFWRNGASGVPGGGPCERCSRSGLGRSTGAGCGADRPAATNAQAAS